MISPARLRIGLLDFEPLRVAGFESLFDEVPGIEVGPSTLEEALSGNSLDMILLGSKSWDAFDLLAKLKAARPTLKMIVMGSGADEDTIISAISAGAKGYLEETASPEQVKLCVGVVESGSIWAPRRVLSAFVDRILNPSGKPLPRHNLSFTKREQEVLKLLVDARSNREIARALGIEERTVKSYVAQLIRKVGVENRIALTVHAASRNKP